MGFMAASSTATSDVMQASRKWYPAGRITTRNLCKAGFPNPITYTKVHRLRFPPNAIRTALTLACLTASATALATCIDCWTTVFMRCVINTGAVVISIKTSAPAPVVQHCQHLYTGLSNGWICPMKIFSSVCAKRIQPINICL